MNGQLIRGFCLAHYVLINNAPEVQTLAPPVRRTYGSISDNTVLLNPNEINHEL